MKKILTFIVAVVLSINVLAQCPLNQAVDFTATDCNGTEIHLFDILDGGQYVLIDFFFYSCDACNATVPFMVESYNAFGCNQHDVFYMEISDRDSDALCQTWDAKYGVEYPTISGVAGGGDIHMQYLIGACPTVILIAPDRSIVVNDIWPIESAQDVITPLENHGVRQYACGTGFNEIIADIFTLYPNPVNDNLTICGRNLENVSVFNTLGQVIFEGFVTGELNLDTSGFQNGIYFVKVGEKVQKFIVNH